MLDRLQHPFDLAGEGTLPVMQLGVPHHGSQKRDDRLFRIEADRLDDVLPGGPVRPDGTRSSPRSLLAVVEIADQPPPPVVVDLDILHTEAGSLSMAR